jgi:uracil-DNA glycosylase
VSPYPFLLFPSLSACTECDLHCQQSLEDGTVIVPNSVGIPTRYLEDSLPPSEVTDAVVYVGRNPGFNEDQDGTCFVGESGRLLMRVYIDGIHVRRRASVYCTNAVRCYTARNDPPKARHYKACLDFTLGDLRPIDTIYGGPLPRQTSRKR